MDNFGQFLMILGKFEQFWTILDNLGGKNCTILTPFGPFWTMLIVLDHVGTYWNVLDSWNILSYLEGFGPFQTILEHVGPFWTILDNFELF